MGLGEKGVSIDIEKGRGVGTVLTCPMDGAIYEPGYAGRLEGAPPLVLPGERWEKITSGYSIVTPPSALGVGYRVRCMLH